MEDWQHGGFGLYVHWPFCQAKCPYCDFNSHVATQIDQGAWQHAYLSEIDRLAAETGPRVLNSVFFGGGTPSLMEPALVDAILTRITSRWPIANDLEVTLEANPTSTEADRFRGYRTAGVNRISIGIQALCDTDLKALGRQHSVDEAIGAFETARSLFDRVSFDLIYARQGQTVADWEAELSRALDMAVDHLSLYQLSIEEGTAFGDRYAAGKLRNLPDDDLAADMYMLTQDICAAAGMPGYEISNHACQGAESVHNRIYWRYGDYLGIGPGAHGRITLDGQRFATQTPLAPATWLRQVNEAGHGEVPREALDLDAMRAEYLLMGMRLAEGVSTKRLDLEDDETLYNKINNLSEMGLIENVDHRLIATPKGRPILNAVLRFLLED